MTLATPDGRISGLVNSPTGLEGLRGMPDGDGFLVTLTTPSGATLTGNLTASADCTALAGTLGAAFNAKRLVDISRDNVTDPAAIAEMSQSLATASALVDDVIARIDLSPNDPATVLATAGSAPEGLRQWVATNTILLSYQGALRSPEQVLADRHGNSLDRARLLAFLLEKAGMTARVSEGRLPTAVLPRLYDITRRELPDPPVLVPDYDLNSLAQRVPTADLEQVVADSQLLAIPEAAATGPTMRIAESLVPLVLPLAETVPALSADYWWAEYDNAGVWTALPLDPLDALPLATRSLAPGDLPEELFHRLTVKVTTETTGPDNKLVEAEVYSGRLLAQGAASGDLKLSFLPGGVPLALSASELMEKAPDTLAALLAEPAWVPVLSIDNEISINNVFVINGRSLTPDAAVAEGFGKHLFGEGGANDFLTDTGGLFGDLADVLNGNDPPPVVEDRLTAVYIDYVIDGPGEQSRVERRTVWDRFGSERRETGQLDIEPLSPEQQIARVDALADTRHIVVQTTTERQESLLKRLAIALAANIAPLRAALKSYADGTLGDVPDTNPAALPPVFFELERRIAFETSVLTVTQRPDIVTYIERPAAPIEGSFPVPDVQIDIVQSGMVPYWLGVDLFSLRLREGVGATVAEAEVSDRGLPVRNTARAYLKSLDEGKPWRVYRSAEALIDNPLPAEIAELVADDLARGNIVVAPTEPIALDVTPWSGYWRIDPLSGETLGVDPRGGATLNEWLMDIHGALSGVMELKKYITLLNAVTRFAALTFCVVSFALSDRGLLAYTMLALCVAGEALNFASNLRSFNKWFAGYRHAKAFATAEEAAKAGFSRPVWEALQKATERLTQYSGTLGSSLDEVYAAGAALGNAIKIVASSVTTIDKLLSKK
jgi:hypothetical protein